MGKWAIVGLLVVAPLLAGCFTHTYVVSGTTPTERPSHVEWRSHLLAGLIALDGDIDLRDRCPQGVAVVEDEMEVFNVLLLLVTGFVYASTTVDIYCQEPTGPAPVAPGEVPVVELPSPSVQGTEPSGDP